MRAIGAEGFGLHREGHVSVTVTETGAVINAEGDAGSFGTYLYTVNVRPGGGCGRGDGATDGPRPRIFARMAAWCPRSSREYGARVVIISGKSRRLTWPQTGSRFFFVEVWDLATRSLAGTIYALEEETSPPRLGLR